MPSRCCSPWDNVRSQWRFLVQALDQLRQPDGGEGLRELCGIERSGRVRIS